MAWQISDGGSPDDRYINSTYTYHAYDFEDIIHHMSIPELSKLIVLATTFRDLLVENQDREQRLATMIEWM